MVKDSIGKMKKEARERSVQPEQGAVEPADPVIGSQEISEGNLSLNFRRFIRAFFKRRRGVLEKLEQSDRNGE